MMEDEQKLIHPRETEGKIEATLNASASKDDAIKKKKPKFILSKNQTKMTKLQANIIIVLILVALGFPFLGFLKPEPKWEYKVETPMDAFFTTSMNNYGDDGWELVTARRAKGALDEFGYECIFKCQK